MKEDIDLYVMVLEQALSSLGQGIVLLLTSGEVLFTSNVAHKMIAKADGLDVQDGKLIGMQAADNQRLQRMLATVAVGDEADHQSFYIHRTADVRPYWLMVSKLKVLNEENLLVVIKDIQANNSYWQERLKSIYKLTNREASFVVLLAEGRNIKEISLVMEIAEDTARQYLKSCFKKMEVNKQHELVCLALDLFRNR